MPTNSWSAKRERQYAHIKEGLLKRGKGTQLAEEIAARTVNKERAQHGEAEQASASSLNDMPASRRCGQQDAMDEQLQCVITPLAGRGHH